MRYKIIYLIGLAAVLACCTFKEDHIFDQSPEERTAEAIELYNSTLLSSPNGWFLNVDTGAEGGFRHWVAFDDGNRVSMLSDFDAYMDWVNSSSTIKESSWRIKKDMVPMLIFDTYNYLHILSDPVGADRPEQHGNGGENGEGLVSDFEFYIMGASNGTLDLTGRYNKRATTLVPTTGRELAAVMAGGLKEVHVKTSNFLIQKDFISGDFNGHIVEFILSPRKVVALYLSSDKLVQVYSGSYPDLSCVTDPDKEGSDIILFQPMTFFGSTITAFEWDGDKFNAVLSDDSKKALDVLPDSQLSLNLGYGKDFSVFTFSTSLPGTQSPEFVTNIFENAINTFEKNRSPRKLDFVNLTFDVDPNHNYRPIIALNFKYLNGSTSYTGTWHYPFTDNDDGTITVTDRDQAGSSNEYTNETHIKTLLNYFCNVSYTTEGTDLVYSSWVKDPTKTVPKTFRIEWVKNKTPGSSALTGALVPVDTGHTGFVPYECVGILEN